MIGRATSLIRLVGFKTFLLVKCYNFVSLASPYMADHFLLTGKNYYHGKQVRNAEEKKIIAAAVYGSCFHFF